MDKVLDKKLTKFWANILETFGGGGRWRYASCGHAGGLSCSINIFGNDRIRQRQYDTFWNITYLRKGTISFCLFEETHFQRK